MRLFLSVLNLIITAGLFAQGPGLMLPVGHTEAITLAAFSPDGQKAVTGSRDKTVKLWDVQTGRLLADFKGHKSSIKILAIDKTGKRLLTGSDVDENVMLWNLSTGGLVKTFDRGSYVDFARFSPDGSKIVMSGYPAALYHSKDGEVAFELSKYGGRIDHGDFHADGKTLVVKQSNDKIGFWDHLTGEQISTFDHYASDFILSQNGRIFITRNILDSSVNIWDFSSRKLLHTIKGFDNTIASIILSPDGSKMVTTTFTTYKTRLWNTSSGRLINELRNSQFDYKKTEFSEDNKAILTPGGLDGTFVWDAETGKTLKEGGYNTDFATFLPGGSNLLIERDEQIEIIDPFSGRNLFNLEGTQGLSFAFFNPVHRQMIGSAKSGRSAAVWDIKTGRSLTEFHSTSDKIFSVKQYDQRSKLVTEHSLGYYHLWKVENSFLFPVKGEIADSVKNTVYSHNGKYVLQQVKGHILLSDVSNGRFVHRFRSGYLLYGDTHLAFSPDDSKVFISSGDKSYVFETQTAKLLNSISHIHASNIATNTALTRLALSGIDKFQLYDLVSGQMLNDMQMNVANYKPFEFTSVNGRILVRSFDGLSLIEEKKNVPLLNILCFETSLNNTGDKLLTANKDTFRVWDLRKAKLIKTLPPWKWESIYTAEWGPDGKYFFYSSNEGFTVKVDPVSGKRLDSVKMAATQINFSPDKSLIYLVFKERVAIANVGKLNMITNLTGHNNDVIAVLPLKDSDKLLTISDDNTAKVWQVPQGKLMYTYLLLDPRYQFSMTPDGYYMASPEASKLLHYVSGDLKVISFEQLDIKYNRPDKVLEAAEVHDTTLLASYKKAYEKRISKLGINTSAFTDIYSLPTADFADRDKIKLEQDDEVLKLNIIASDSNSQLDRYNIWVNDSPLFGVQGMSLKKSNVSPISIPITIHLSAGDNIIATSVSNTNGLESFRMPIRVKYTPDIPVKTKLHFIGIGIDEFKEPGHNLSYSVKDVRDLAIKLKEKYKDAITIDTLFNQDVRVSNVTALKKKLLNTSVNDKVILSYSGHGLLSKDFDYFLSTYNVDFEKPENGGLPYDALESLLDSIPARRKLMLIDACHSGEVDKEEMQQYRQVLTANAGTGLKGAIVENKDSSKIGMKNSFELMQELFVNVGRSTGATIISAAAGTQLAQERGDLKNGVFTFSILEYMEQHPTATVTELKNYVNKRVPELTNGLQVPTTRTETKAVDWKVW